MSTNLIDGMTEREAKDLLNSICHSMGIGGKARTKSIILTNIENGSRRSECLGRIENHFTQEIMDEDDQPSEECLLSWGASPDQYLKDFLAAIDYNSDLLV